MKRKFILSPLIIVILIIIVGIGTAGAAIYFGGVLNTGSQNSPVGWWKFDGNAKDSTPNSDHGIVTGATLTTDRKEEVDKAYSFNGTTDHITASDSAALDATTAVTVEFWVKSN